jgi:cell division protein FtsB
MSPIERRHTYAYYQLLALLILLLGTYAIGSMAILWLRQQNAQVAARIETVEREIAQVERRIRYLDTKIAEIHHPAYLRARATELGLNLQRPGERQLVYLGVPRDVRPDRAPERGPADRDPFRTTFDLAVMEPLRANN